MSEAAPADRSAGPRQRALRGADPRRAADAVLRVLRGALPARLPIDPGRVRGSPGRGSCGRPASRSRHPGSSTARRARRPRGRLSRRPASRSSSPPRRWRRRRATAAWPSRASTGRSSSGTTAGPSGSEPDLDEVEATRGSSLLGSIMLANILGREGRRYLTVASVDGDAAARGSSGHAARRRRPRLRGARLGLLGGTIAGYDNVVLEPAAAAALGIELVTRRCRRRGARDGWLRASVRMDRPDRLPDGLEPTPTPPSRSSIARMRVHRFLAAAGRAGAARCARAQLPLRRPALRRGDRRRGLPGVDAAVVGRECPSPARATA